MRIARRTSRTVVVLASTFPRWPNDSVPPFVWAFVQRLAPFTGAIRVIAPHFAGARSRERLTNVIKVQRFRYALPKYENLAYGQFAKSRFYLVKTLSYAVAEFFVTLKTCLVNQPVVINAHWLIPQGFVAVLVGRILHVPVVVTVHGSDIFMFNGRMFTAFKRLTLRYADAVITNSSVTQAACREIWPDREYPIIPMGIDTTMFPVKKSVKGTSIPYEMLFVGRLARIKGVHQLCEATRVLHDEGLLVHLSIVGDGPERESLERYINKQELNQVITIVGWVQLEDLPAYYAQADVFIGPSIEDEHGRKEALGLVFAEAAAAGLPVITTNAGGMVDIVEHEKTGLIVPQKDSAAIANAVRYLYEHPREAIKMGRRGRELIVGHMSWERVAERYRIILGL